MGLSRPPHVSFCKTTLHQWAIHPFVAVIYLKGENLYHLCLRTLAPLFSLFFAGSTADSKSKRSNRCGTNDNQTAFACGKSRPSETLSGSRKVGNLSNSVHIPKI